MNINLNECIALFTLTFSSVLRRLTYLLVNYKPVGIFVPKSVKI